MNDELENNQPKVLQPTSTEGLLNKIKNFLFQQYEPVSTPQEATIHLTTKELFDQLHSLFPSDFFTQDLLAQWLHEGQFSFYDYSGNLKLEWMLKKA